MLPWMDTLQFVYPFIHWGTFGLFPPLTLWTMLLWICLYTCFREQLPSVLWSIYLRVELLGRVCGNSMLRFSRSCQTVFHGSWTILHHPTQQCVRVPTSWHSTQHLLLAIKKEWWPSECLWSNTFLWFWFTFPEWPITLETFFFLMASINGEGSIKSVSYTVGPLNSCSFNCALG